MDVNQHEFGLGLGAAADADTEDAARDLKHLLEVVVGELGLLDESRDAASGGVGPC